MVRYCLLAALVLVSGCRTQLPPSADGRKEVPLKLVNVRAFKMGQPDAVLMLTGGSGGLLEVCNCSGPMPGGLSRRSGLVQSYRKTFTDTMLVDAGDTFWIEPTDIRNEYMLRGYGQIGYDAVVLGDQEWAAGPKRLSEILTENNTPALSTSVSGAGVVTAKAARREFANAKIAVVSDISREAFHFVPKSLVGKLQFSEPAEINQQIDELKSQGYIVVLIAHAGEKSIEKIASSTKADLVVQGHTTRTNKKLTRVNGKPVIKVGGYEYVGVVAIKADGNKISDVEYRAELVSTSWPLDGKLLLTYQAYAHEAMMKALDAERTTGLDYQSSASCGQCHKKEYANWKKTAHSKAYATLQKVKRTGDPSCVMCHTSGFGTKKGFYTYAKTRHLANVNCQNCHRFNAAEHRKKDFTIEPVGREICQTCHTPVTDPKFEFKAKRKKILCSGHPGSESDTPSAH